MTPDVIWIEQTQVKSFETDYLGRWKPSVLFQTMEEVATHHAASFGFTLESMLKRNMIWILSRVKVQIKELPKVQEPVLIQTWSRGVQQKIFFGRDFYFHKEDGTNYASASTLWILFNPDTRRIVMPQLLTEYYPALPDKHAIDKSIEKIAVSDHLSQQLVIKTGYSSVDLMNHVNNSTYINWICDCFTSIILSGKSLKEIQINYTNEVKIGESISISTGKREENKNTWMVEGFNLTTQAKAFESELTFG